MELNILQNFLIALGLGALIGLEREYARFRKRGHDYAGIRTFPLIALFGALSAYLGDLISPWILIVGILLAGILVIVAYYVIVKSTFWCYFRNGWFSYFLFRSFSLL